MESALQSSSDPTPLSPKACKNDSLNDEFFKYLHYKTSSEINSQYLTILSNNPSSLFTSINFELILMWQSSLYSTITPTPLTDKDILSTDTTHPNQKIIYNDCLRTRVRESILYPGDFKLILQQILTRFCTIHNIQYKQGLNEIFGPLLLMKYKLPSINLSTVFQIGECIIKKYLVNYYFEKDFFAYRSSLNIFTLLLKYHVPQVYNILDKLMILPEMYVTSWLLTLLASKIQLDLTYHIWNHIIKSNDNLLVHFIIVALLKEKSELILNTDYTLIPILISNLVFLSINEVDIILQQAYEIRQATPYSFRVLADKLEIFKEGSTSLKDKYEWFQNEGIEIMPIFSSELLYFAYKPNFKCPNGKCRQNKSKTQKRNLNLTKINNAYICEYCDMKICKQMNYILIDLRMYEGEEEKRGLLPMSITVPQEELKSEDFCERITDRFIHDKGNLHFVFLNSHTKLFNEMERNYYKDNITEEEKNNMMIGIEMKINKVLDPEKAQTNRKKEDIYNLKEYDNLKITLQSLLKENFPYIAYVYGGFNLIHNHIRKYDNITLINHEEEECILCNKNIKNKNNNESDSYNVQPNYEERIFFNQFGINDSVNNIQEINNKVKKNKKKDKLNSKELIGSLWQHKQKYKYSELAIKIENENNFANFCLLMEYNNIKPPGGPIQVLFLLLNSEKIIELYQIEKTKVYELGKKTLTNKGLNTIEINQRNTVRPKEMELILVEKIDIEKVRNFRHHNNQKTLTILTYEKDIIRNDNKKEASDNGGEEKKSCSFILDMVNKSDFKKITTMLKTISTTIKTNI